MRSCRSSICRAIVCTAFLATAAAAAEPKTGLRAFLVVRGDEVLAAESPELAMTPGSVTKLATVAAALHHLGPEHRVVTSVVGGPLAGGVLQGDLVVVGAGDPTWNDRFFEDGARAPLAEIARTLKKRGLRRVAGDLVADASRFPGRGAATSRPASELAYSYGAPSSALAVDENAVTVEIAPGPRVGEPATLRPLAAARRLEWIHDMRTVSAKRHERGTVDFLPVWGTHRLVVRGEYPVSEPSYKVAVAVPAPELFAAQALAEALAAEGISVAGEVRVSFLPGASQPGEVLARLASPPLAELLEPILRDSHNFYAEALLRILAAEVRGEGRDDEGLELVESFLVEEVGADGGFLLDDGSGLSPYNLLSPAVVVELLRWARRQSWRDVFLAALARPGRGTLRGWDRPPSGLAAKTGSVRGAFALAGYVETGGEPVVFACFLGHRREERGVLRAEMAAWLRGIGR